MKRIICILIAVMTAAILLSSCSGKKDAEDTTAKTTAVQEISDEYDEKGNVKVRNYNSPDGKLVYKTEYSYDENNNVISEKKMKADGTFDSLIKYEYKKVGDEYKESKKTVYKSEKEIDYYFSDYEYKEAVTDGVKEILTLSYIRYNADGSFFEKFHFVYDESNALKACETLDEKGNIRTKTEY